MRSFFLWLTLTWVCAAAAEPTAAPFFQQPTMNRTHIVFVYAGDLWKVSRDGGDAVRLTTGAGQELDPHFSPDGVTIAFTGEYEGNFDVYTIPSDGGVPKRLTHHPAQDRATGWTRDGKSVLFRSSRASYSPRFDRLFTVAATGGFPTEMPLPMAIGGSYSPDGARFAYVPFDDNRALRLFDAWKRYRGGKARPIWIATLSDSSIEKLPRKDSNDTHPMWVGEKIYFLSDRNGPTSLFVYDLPKKTVAQVLPNSGLGIKTASLGPDGIVYDQFGALHVFDTKNHKTKPIGVRVTGDLAELRPRFINVANQLTNSSLSPTGARALFEAHGEILTVPADKGDVRNLTNTPGVMERAPAWSPDGRWISYFSDESGEYALHLRQQNGSGDVRKVELPKPTGFYFEPAWSPDSKKIVFRDNRLNLWFADIESSKVTKVDTDEYYDPATLISFSSVWSPDSKWIAYAKQLKNHLHTVFMYSVETGKSTQVTDGLSDSRYLAFDPNGKYLYFTGSTNAGTTKGWLDMSTDSFVATRNVYVVVLDKKQPSPLAPESDEEKLVEAEKKDAEKKDAAKPADGNLVVKVDFDNIQQRILSLPIPPRIYTGLRVGKTGIVFVTERDAPFRDPQGVVVHKFDLKTRKLEQVAPLATDFEVSRNGEKILLKTAGRYSIQSISTPPKPGEGVLKTEAMEVKIDPRAEWKQMYNEVWRMQRDYFYDPNYHGLDLESTKKKYEPYLDQVASRSDLNYLFQEMLGEITVGHLYIGGGAFPQVKNVPTGLLGADFEIANGRYRIKRIYNGENWNPSLRAPLTQPGIDVQPGSYILAVNGRELRDTDEIYAFFEGTADKSATLRLADDATGTNAREVVVVPVPSEVGLRNLAWIEGNRRRVDQLSNGRIAYVYMPNTGTGGFESFNRYFYAQVDKEGLVLDERFNGGGQAADYVIDVLRRPLLNHWVTRYGQDSRTPVGAIFGPKAMIVNEFAGSGGDAMPWYFRRTKLGPLVGKRTWGGLVGILGFPPLMDGGSVTSPNIAFVSPEGKWEVENYGVAPDIEVEHDPKAVREGRDPQLERAVAVVMEQLSKTPAPALKRPDYPNYHPRPAVTSTRASERAGK